MKFAPIVFALAFVGPLAFAAEGVREAEAPLTRAEGSPFHEAGGSCDIREGSDFQRFRLTLRGVGVDAPLSVLIANGQELVSVGTVPPGPSPRVFLRTTQEGGQLPFGVELAASLSGRMVQVRDGEQHVVLNGTIPSFKAPEPPPPVPVTDPEVARTYMHRTEAALDLEPRGGISATRRDGSSALRVEVSRLAPESVYLVRVGFDGDGTLVGDFRTNREGGADWSRDTARGQTLPLNATDVSTLAGKRLVIATTEGVVLLVGEVPSFEHSETPVENVHERDRFHDEASGADTRVEVVIRTETGHERLNVECRDIPRERHEDPALKRRAAEFAEVWLADGSGTLVQVDTVRIRRTRVAVWRYLARRGDALPFGATSLRALSGRAFEIRLNGSAVASGALPTF